MLEETRRREAELERQKRNQVSLEEIQLLRDFRTSLIMPHLAKEFDILRSSSPENTIQEVPEPSTSEQKATFQHVAPLSPPPRKAKAPAITNSPAGTALQVSPWMESTEQQPKEPETPVSEFFDGNATPSIYSTTSTLDSEQSDQPSDQYRDLAAWRSERSKRHYSNQIFGGKQRLDHYRLAKERSKTTLHESTIDENQYIESPPVSPGRQKPLPAIVAENDHDVEELCIGEKAPVVEIASIFPKELSRSTVQPLAPLPTASRPKPRGRNRPDIRRYSTDPLSKWMDHTTIGYDNDNSLEMNENYFFNDFSPDALNRRPRPKSRRMSKAAAKHLAENATGKSANPGKIDLAAIAKHLHENRLSVIQERKQISATEEDEQELARLLSDPQQANILEMHRDIASTNPPVPTSQFRVPKSSSTNTLTNDKAMSSAQAASAAIMRTRSASTSRADMQVSGFEFPKPSGLSSSSSMRITPLHSKSSSQSGSRPIHFLGSSRDDLSTVDKNERGLEADNDDVGQTDIQLGQVDADDTKLPLPLNAASEKADLIDAPNVDLSKKIQLNDKAVLSRAGSTVDRSPSTRLAAIQGIQKHLLGKSTHASQNTEDKETTNEDESTLIEEIPVTPILEERSLIRGQSVSTPVNAKGRKEKPRIALVDTSATDLISPTAFVSPRTAPAPPTVDGDAMYSGSKSHDDRKKTFNSRLRTKSSNDADESEKDTKGGFLQFRRQVSKLRRPRAGSESVSEPKVGGLKHAISHDTIKGISRYGSIENLRDGRSQGGTNDSTPSSTSNGMLPLPSNGQPRRSISMREIRSPSMEREDPLVNMAVRPNHHRSGEDLTARKRQQPSSPSQTMLHRPSTSISSTLSGSSEDKLSQRNWSSEGRSTSEDSIGSPHILPRNPLRHSRDESGKSKAAIGRSVSYRGTDRISNDHKVLSQSRLKDGENHVIPKSTLSSSKMSPAALIAMKHSDDANDVPTRPDSDQYSKKMERQPSASKGIRMISQLLGKSGKKNSTKRINEDGPNRAPTNGFPEIATDIHRQGSTSRSSQVVRRMIIYVQPEDSEEHTQPPSTANHVFNSIQERTSTSSESSHINSPDSDSAQEYVTAKVVTRQPSLKKTVVDADQPKAAANSGLTRKGTNGRKWRLENVAEETEVEHGTAVANDNEAVPRQSSSSSIPRSSYDNESIYKFYDGRQSTSERSLDSVQRATMRSAAHAQLEGLEVREMSDGSVVYGIVKKDRNGRRTSVLLPTKPDQHHTETEILTSDEDEDDIEERVLQMMGYNPNSPRLSDFMNVDRRSKTSREILPSRSSDRSQRLPPPQYPPPPIPVRSPRRMASIKQQQQLKPKVTRVQDHRAKHVSTICSKSPDGTGSTTDIYLAEEVTLSGLLDMIKDKESGDDAYTDDYYGEYYSDQTYFPDSDTEVSERLSKPTVEEKLDDALKTWEQSSTREPSHFR
jgi:hypothetical protein